MSKTQLMMKMILVSSMGILSAQAAEDYYEKEINDLKLQRQELVSHISVGGSYGRAMENRMDQLGDRISELREQQRKYLEQQDESQGSKRY